jgi:phospho-N-acetylmuramoyl-pentapeptide-transferase
MQEALRALLIQDMARGLLLAAAAALIVLLTGGGWIAILKRANIRKRARNEGSDTMVSYGQITMGGIMIIVPVVILTIIFNLIDRWSMLLPLAVMLGYGLLGAVDDYYSLDVVQSKNYGLTERVKGALQWLIAVIASVILYLPAPYGLDHSGLVFVPFVGPLDVGIYVIPIAACIIWVTVNAVNITDGVDGLSGWTLMVAFGAYGVIAFLNGEFTNLMALCFTLVGACAGYLWYNAHPATVIMGDLGSMAFGGVLAIIALQSQQWLLLPIVGIIFVVEGLSSFLQIGYFKYTRRVTGTPVRLLKMAPLHHHLRMTGWSNPQITQRFVVITMACAMIAIALAMRV